MCQADGNFPPRAEFACLLPGDLAGEPLLAAYLSAHRSMINGSALCAALAVTERDRPGGLTIAKPFRTLNTRVIRVAPVFSRNTLGWC